MATKHMPSSQTMFILALMHVPLFGLLAHAAVSERLRRFVVLTDRRLILLPIHKRGLHPKQRMHQVELPIGGLMIQRTRNRMMAEWFRASPRFVIIGEGLPGPVDISLQRSKLSTSLRLIEGLMLLSEEEPEIESEPSLVGE